MTPRHSKTLKTQRGFSVAELLVALALAGTLAVLSLNLILRDPTSKWMKVVDDYIHHLTSVYRVIDQKYGNTPLNATDASDVAIGSIGSYLLTWETAVKTGTTPNRLEYPSGMVVYLNPDQSSADPNNEIANDADNAATGPFLPSDADIMASTQDGEWLLFDMNGTSGANSIASTGDRVLLYVEDSTGRVLTAKQKCDELTCAAAFGQSFYDVAKGY